MSKSSKAPARFGFGFIPAKLQVAAIKDPRVVMRAIIGALLAANLVAGIMAFKPFGGSADDLRKEQADLSGQVRAMRDRANLSKRLVEKVQGARKDGDQFLSDYVLDRRSAYSALDDELNRTATAAGIKMLPASFDPQPIEGSDTLGQLSIVAGFEGTYPAIMKFVNLLDKSPRFLIIESMQAAPQQNGQTINVQFKVDAFYNDLTGATP
jgi:type IV pilus assembly protein PilO